MSYVDMRDVLEKTPVDNISDYDNPNSAGLLDYKYFTEFGSKELLIRNRTGDPTKWVKFTFSASNTLNWALGERVL